MSDNPKSTATFTLRWRRADGSTYDVPYDYFGRASKLQQYINECISVGQPGGDVTIVGRVDEKTGYAVCLLSRSEYHKFAEREDKGQIILETEEGRKEVWVEQPLLHPDDPPNMRLIQIHNRLYEFQRVINGADAEKLTRRWKGVDPDEDADLDAPSVDHGHPNLGVEAPPQPDPPKQVGELDILHRAEELADKMNVEINDDNRAMFVERATAQLQAEARAPVLNVPALEHDQIQEAVIMRRNPETGELEVTHTYHDLHAPEGETTTIQMSGEAHEMMAGLIAALALDDGPTQRNLNPVASKIRAGQVWDWPDVEKRARAAVPHGEGGNVRSYAKALGEIETICLVMAQEQDNRPQHGWKVSWPGGEIHMAPHADAMTLCDHKLGGWLWILPVRFKQCGPVPFGPMCPDCVKALEEMSPDDLRLTPPENRPGYETNEFSVSVGYFIGDNVNANEEPASIVQRVQRTTEGQQVDWRAVGGAALKQCNSNHARGVVTQIMRDLGHEPDPPEPNETLFDVVEEVPWVTSDIADPVQDLIAAHLQGQGLEAPWAEEDVRRAVRYFKANGLFGEKVDEDATAARLLGPNRPIGARRFSMEGPWPFGEYMEHDETEARHVRIRRGEPEPIEFHRSVGRAIVELLAGKYSSDPDDEMKYVEDVVVPRVKALIGNSYVLLHFIAEEATRGARETAPYTADIILRVMQRLDPNYAEGQKQAANSRHFYTGSSSDPVYDMVVADHTPGWTEASARGFLSALVGTGTLVRWAWPDERIATEAHRIYRKWQRATSNTNSKEAVDAETALEGGVGEGE